MKNKLIHIIDNVNDKISYGIIKSILDNFSILLNIK